MSGADELKPTSASECPPPAGAQVPPPTSGNGEGKADQNAEAWKSFAMDFVEVLAINASNFFSRPTMTMGVLLPASFLVGRFGLVSTPMGIFLCAGLMGLAYVSDKKRKQNQFKTSEEGGDAWPGVSIPVWNDPNAPTGGSSKEEFRKRAESVEWLNQFVRHLWLRYPTWVGDWLIRDVILGEILEGLRRDKVFHRCSLLAACSATVTCLLTFCLCVGDSGRSHQRHPVHKGHPARFIPMGDGS